MSFVSDIFGSAVFHDGVMKERLPREIYRSLRETRDSGKPLDPSVATVVASVMKDWAVEKGATHFTHWFQPMTGITAEKHNSFISPAPDGRVIMEFSGKELVVGESDASSFPSGGLRATFEARGYTAWDPTSNAFVKDTTLYIPTAFCSYSGEALDKKTPLLRSMEAVSKQAVRVLKLLGNTASKRVDVTVGPEQEYFLIDRSLWEKRRDLMYTGRTLFGCKPPKGQEMDDHYYGSIKQRVNDFMKEVDEQLWRMGVFAKTKHNEVAPAQHELAPIFETANISADHNQVVMETLKKVAEKHGLACLLHEKPFKGINGSGKHNNWSLCTDDGINLLEPGESPQENEQFLLFLCSVIRAVDEHADLLRFSVATAGNDHRLGANEAPPAIVSIFLGDQLREILQSFSLGEVARGGEVTVMETGVRSLPRLHRDMTDRNRTSPFAFTGNKFEFRMAGSSMSISEQNVVLSTAVADVLSRFAERLESVSDVRREVRRIIGDTARSNGRVIFDGNSYGDDWRAEAARRGLPDIRNTADAAPYFIKPENVSLFLRHKVYTETEIHSRYEVYLESYRKTVNIEGETMVEMARREIAPACVRYKREVCEARLAAKACGADSHLEDALIERLGGLTAALDENIRSLDQTLSSLPSGGSLELARHYRDKVLPAMNELRESADGLEEIVAADVWPFPTYGDLLYRV